MEALYGSDSKIRVPMLPTRLNVTTVFFVKARFSRHGSSLQVGLAQGPVRLVSDRLHIPEANGSGCIQKIVGEHISFASSPLIDHEHHACQRTRSFLCNRSHPSHVLWKMLQGELEISMRWMPRRRLLQQGVPKGGMELAQVRAISDSPPPRSLEPIIHSRLH